MRFTEHPDGLPVMGYEMSVVSNGVDLETVSGGAVVASTNQMLLEWGFPGVVEVDTVASQIKIPNLSDRSRRILGISVDACDALGGTTGNTTTVRVSNASSGATGIALGVDGASRVGSATGEVSWAVGGYIYVRREAAAGKHVGIRGHLLVEDVLT